MPLFLNDRGYLIISTAQSIHTLIAHWQTVSSLEMHKGTDREVFIRILSAKCVAGIAGVEFVKIQHVTGGSYQPLWSTDGFA